MDTTKLLVRIIVKECSMIRAAYKMTTLFRLEETREVVMILTIVAVRRSTSQLFKEDTRMFINQVFRESGPRLM